jgi:hypothetical protein
MAADTSWTVLLGLLTILALISVPLFGGRLSALSNLKVDALPHLYLAFALQIEVIEIAADTPAPWPAIGHVSSYVLAAYVLWRNRRIPFLWLIALGGGSNSLAIAANQGVMPARPGALATAGLKPEIGEFANSAVVAHPHLAILGDYFAVPASWPVANVFSIGDVLIAVGLGACLHVLCGSHLTRRSARGPHPTRGLPAGAAPPAPRSSDGSVMPGCPRPAAPRRA